MLLFRLPVAVSIIFLIRRRRSSLIVWRQRRRTACRTKRVVKAIVVKIGCGGRSTHSRWCQPWQGGVADTCVPLEQSATLRCIICLWVFTNDSRRVLSWEPQGRLCCKSLGVIHSMGVIGSFGFIIFLDAVNYLKVRKFWIIIIFKWTIISVLFTSCAVGGERVVIVILIHRVTTVLGVTPRHVESREGR